MSVSQSVRPLLFVPGGQTFFTRWRAGWGTNNFDILGGTNIFDTQGGGDEQIVCPPGTNKRGHTHPLTKRFIYIDIL